MGVFIDIEYTTDEGESWELIVDSLFVYQLYNFDWQIPFLNSENCLIRIGSYPCAYDVSDSAFTITYPVTAENEDVLPTEFSLSQNYPNPFNPTTKIRFKIPLLGGEEKGELVTLKVYDVLGNEIATLVNEEKPPGEYEVEFSRNLINQVLTSGISAKGGYASGVYFYQLQAGDFVETKKMLLLQ